MSVSTEVQRTLVKSPPELWAELSDPEALGRHLGEMGEVRITRAEPEALLEWEADGARGSVALSGSGFGTKVVLSLTREVSEPQAPVEPEHAIDVEPLTDETEPQATVEPEPPAEEPQASATVEPEPLMEEPHVPEAVEPEPIVEPEPEPPVASEPEPIAVGPAQDAPEPRRGLFARLFRRNAPAPAPPVLDLIKPESAVLAVGPIVRTAPVVAEPEPAASPSPEPEPIAVAEPEPEPAEPPANLAADLAAIEAQMAEQDSELLTGVLDRLGAAHHRPFSRG